MLNIDDAWKLWTLRELGYSEMTTISAGSFIDQIPAVFPGIPGTLKIGGDPGSSPGIPG